MPWANVDQPKDDPLHHSDLQTMVSLKMNDLVLDTIYPSSKCIKFLLSFSLKRKKFVHLMNK